MDLVSPAFEQHQPIPKKYTCEGEDISPPLVISDVPAGTASLALVVDDPDAPRGTFDHWIAWNIDPETRKLDEGSSQSHMGINGFGVEKYRGPCPPPGNPHRYFFKLYALDTFLDLSSGSTKYQLEEAMEGHILVKTELIGTYRR